VKSRSLLARLFHQLLWHGRRPLFTVLLITGLLLTAVAALPATAGAKPASPVPLASERHDVTVRSTAIPNRLLQVGTLRLLKRGATVVLQTDLDTTLLSRVLAAIKEREQSRWKTGTPEGDDMKRYLQQLDDAVALVEKRVTVRPSGQDRRRRLQIEFIADPPRYLIVLLTREPAGPWEAFAPLRVSAGYLYGDMLEILLENLVETPAEARALLRTLLPPGTTLPEPGK